VAVKLLHGGGEGITSTTVRRFQREAHAAMAVKSEHIAEVLDAGFDDGASAPYMVLELLSGEDLGAVHRRLGSLAPECALRIAGQACLGLQRAHEAGIVHRDIKPANLFLALGEGGRRTVKLLDFGIAKILEQRDGGEESTGLTRTGSAVGSPLYMSPEQARGLKSIDFRTDIWSLGVVLYAALTGRPPHHDIHSFTDLIFSLCTCSPPSVQEKAPWIPTEVAAIVHGALRLEREDRFPSAAAMLAQIRELLPGGLDLTEDMLAPLGDTERSRAAPTLESTVKLEAATMVITARR
jgi:serine/threonine-protein kinase